MMWLWLASKHIFRQKVGSYLCFLLLWTYVLIIIISKVLLLLLHAECLHWIKSLITSNGCQTFWIQFSSLWLSLFSKLLGTSRTKISIVGHEADNTYNYFAIKACTRGSNSRTVGHLPMKISRPTKYILQRGVKVVATLLLQIIEDHR